MALLDSQGRLFGKVNILDVAAGLLVLLVLAGIFLFPGSSGSVAQIGVSRKPVEIDVVVRGLSVSNPSEFLEMMKNSQKTSIVIRNQPYGDIDIKSVKPLPRSVSVPQPDGTVQAYPDPRPELAYTVDMLMTLGGEGDIVDDGLVLGNNKIKIGTVLELEGLTYRFNSSVIGVRVLENPQS